jgi:oligopeptide/dipeptide ABC transporter ATP-binding protein
MALFGQLQNDLGMAMLMITHDVGVVQDLGGKVGVMYAGRLVESGDVADVLNRPKHPYTRGLLDCLPDPTIARGELRVIPGQPPLTGERPAGCAFAPRCSLAQDACRGAEPPLMPLPRTAQLAEHEVRASACLVENPVIGEYFDSREEVPA